MNSLEFSQLTSENGTKLTRTLIKRHCIGYQAASSRAYISSLPLIFSPSRLSKLLSPQIFIKDKASDYSVVLMPNSLDNVNCQLYPTTHILSDSLLLDNIYKYLVSGHSETLSNSFLLTALVMVEVPLDQYCTLFCIFRNYFIQS